MAIRVNPNAKLLKNLCRQFIRPLSSTPSSLPILPLNFEEKPEPEPTTVSKTHESQTRTRTQTQTHSSILDLDDTQKLFSTFSTSKLMRSAVTLNMAAIDRVVDMGIWVMKSRLMDTPVLRDVILKGVEHTFYEQFVAGKDLEETSRTVEKIWDAGLRAMLVYGLEHAHDNDACDRNFQTFYNTIESTKSFPQSSGYTMGTNNLTWDPHHELTASREVHETDVRSRTSGHRKERERLFPLDPERFDERALDLTIALGQDYHWWW